MELRAIRGALTALRWVVPAELRPAWCRKWRDGLDHYAAWLDSRGMAKQTRAAHLRQYLRDARNEASSLRWPDGGPAAVLNSAIRSPWIPIAMSAALLLAGNWISGGFASMRAAFAPFPALVTAEPERSFFGKQPGFTSRQFFRLRERARSFDVAAGYAVRQYSIVPPEGGARNVRMAFATSGLFPALGMAEPDDAAVSERWAGWLGRKIEIDGRRHRVTAVWPRHLRVGLTRPDVWVVLPDETLAARGYDMSLVARLAPGVSLPSATAEMRDLLLTAPPRRGTGTPTAVVPMRHGLRPLFEVVQVGFLAVVFFLALAAGAMAWRARRWKPPLFFLAKIIPLMTGLLGFTVWAAGIPGSGSPAGPFWTLWWAATAAALAVWWAVRDQRLRCPECLRRMTLAVQIGTHGSSLLEGVGDELLCDRGHGALWLPAVPSQAFGPEVWRDS